MFDELGRVIGMVVLKGRIEGAGFAVPADTLADFLLQNLREEPDSFAIKRSWNDTKGKGPLVATFMGFSEGKVGLKRISDGKEFRIPLETLSKPDQLFVQELNKHNPKLPN